MIIIAYKPGQLANRLFLFAKFIAYALQHNIRTINPAFDDYSHYFETTRKQFIPASRGLRGPSSRFIIRRIYQLCFLFGRILHRMKMSSRILSVTYLDWSEHYPLDTDAQLAEKGIHFIQGWEFDASVLMTKHREKIIHFFRPASELMQRIEKRFDALRGLETLVGVHIRHGDYQFFEGGKYFYDLAKYKSLITGLVQKHPRITILISTNNRSISRNDFDGYQVVMAPGHELEDLYLLARCHYIMGPPSTYSLWASYYGNVPLYQIKDANCDVSLADFKIYLQ